MRVAALRGWGDIRWQGNDFRQKGALMVMAKRRGKTVVAEIDPMDGGRWQWRVVEKVGQLEHDRFSGEAANKNAAVRLAAAGVSLVLGEK